jgi:hypothetical protein
MHPPLFFPEIHVDRTGLNKTYAHFSVKESSRNTQPTWEALPQRMLPACADPRYSCH